MADGDTPGGSWRENFRRQVLVGTCSLVLASGIVGATVYAARLVFDAANPSWWRWLSWPVAAGILSILAGLPFVAAMDRANARQRDERAVKEAAQEAEVEALWNQLDALTNDLEGLKRAHVGVAESMTEDLRRMHEELVSLRRGQTELAGADRNVIQMQQQMLDVLKTRDETIERLRAAVIHLQRKSPDFLGPKHPQV